MTVDAAHALQLLRFMWVGFSLFAVLSQLYVVRESYRDLVVARRGNGARLMLAKLGVQTEVIMILIQVIYGTVGLYAVSQPVPAEVSWASLVLAFALSSINLALWLLAVSRILVRRRLYRMMPPGGK